MLEEYYLSLSFSLARFRLVWLGSFSSCSDTSLSSCEGSAWGARIFLASNLKIWDDLRIKDFVRVKERRGEGGTSGSADVLVMVLTGSSCNDAIFSRQQTILHAKRSQRTIGWIKLGRFRLSHVDTKSKLGRLTNILKILTVSLDRVSLQTYSNSFSAPREAKGPLHCLLHDEQSIDPNRFGDSLSVLFVRVAYVHVEYTPICNFGPELVVGLWHRFQRALFFG